MDTMNHKDEGTNRQYGIQPYTHREFPPGRDITPYPHTPEDEQENVHLRDYLHVILKRKWIIFAFFISAVVTTTVVSFLMPPVYISSTVIKIDDQNPNALTTQGVQVINPGPDYFMTQYELIKSRALAEKVIKKLNLANNDRFLPVQNILSRAVNVILSPIETAFSSAASLFKSKEEADTGSSSSVTAPANPEVPLYLSFALTSRLQVKPVKDSELATITFESNYPEISVSVANAVAESFIEYDLETRIDANRRAQEFLEKQIADLKAKTEEDENRLNNYATKNEIVFLESGKGSVLSQKLSEINNSLSFATTERMKKEAVYKQIMESGTSIPDILNNSVIQDLVKQHAALEAEYSNLSQTFTPDFPKMKNLKKQIDAVASRLELEKSHLTQSIQADYAAALKKEKYLKSSFDSLQSQVLAFQERAVQYESLKRSIDVNKGLHNTLLQKLNEVGIAVMSKASRIQIVDSAAFPKRPTKPDMQRNFFLSVIIGLMGGVGLAFFVEYFDNTVKDTQEIERNIRLPSLGVIPLQERLIPNAITRSLLTGPDITDPVSEAFRSIGTFLLLSSASHPPKTILITSPNAKEGKTTICINIASALSEAVGNGIIIDADMRKPRLHHIFKVDNKDGLSRYLSGNIPFSEEDGRLMKPTSIKGVSVIPSGPTPPNPSELLYSSRMKDLLDALQARYNFVIIDAPPVMGIPDSILLSNLVDGTVLVVRSGETQKSALAETKRIFNSVNTKLLGVVLNGVTKNDLKYDYYSHYYSSHFAE